MLRITRYGVLAGLMTLGLMGPAAAQPEAWQAVIERVSATEFILEPDGLDKMLSDPAWLGRQGRVVPTFINGQNQGFKFAGIRKGSFWALLGLKNGDIVRAANGLSLDSPSKALEAYQQIRGASFVIDIVRRGVAMRMTYNLRGRAKAVAPPSLAPMPTAKAKPPPHAAPRAYQGGGRLRAHVALDFGETPGDVAGTLRVMTDSPVVWGEITGPKPGLPELDFGRGELLIKVSPGSPAPSVQIVTLTVDDGDIAVTTDPKSTIVFKPGRGLAGARLDLRLALTAGAKADSTMQALFSAGSGMTMTCRGSVLAPRCRLNRPTAE